ncbi:hypothetical protein RZR97_09995 [Hydrogenimonas thermophila]|uniref:hypothetical protein n=1 Tax=Hydrogenimonas thermophila TaxID=223786 RepID=UPI002937198C|nr:hypothetical protein [Hydrogenimonas thermophila]WOE69434.1 hypothetical protein RZR91_10025 [Hydrogenimonas thermophila]WOE71943.1 hypothetical protein RZR97_09995 [Hydrogenimonas thermophila]
MAFIGNKKIIGSFITVMLLSGCNNSSVDSNNLSAQFIDSYVSGLEYICGPNNGITNETGTFTYSTTDCSEVTFKIGNLVIGSIAVNDINSDQKVYPADLLGLDRNVTNDNEQLTNIIQLLQSLDSDQDPSNGIDINETTRNLLSSPTVTDVNISSLTDINNTLSSIEGLNFKLVDKNSSVAHYEETIRKDLNISVDTVPPVAPKIVSDNNLTNSDVKQIEISGEFGAHVIIDGVDTNITIPETRKVLVDLNTSGEDGEKSFEIKLMDSTKKISEPITIIIKKDSTPPNMPSFVTEPPSVTTSDTVTVTIKGEPGSEVFVGGISQGIIGENGEITVSIDTSGADGNKSFEIILIDSAGNESQSLASTIVKDTTPPQKPSVVTNANITNDQISVTIKGELNAKVYVDGQLYGKIGTDGYYTAKLTNPNSSYYEKFDIYLEDEAGNKSETFTFITTFNRYSIDSNTTYFVPENLTVLKDAQDNEEVIIMSYGEDSNVTGAVAKIYMTVDETVSEKLQKLIDSIKTLTNISDINNLTEQANSTDTAILAEYTINTSVSIDTISLINDIINKIMGESLTNLPSATSNTASTSSFNAVFNLIKDADGKSYVAVSIVPSSEYLIYKGVVDSIVSSNNIVNNNIEYLQETESFEVNATTANQTADFLFVVDNSSSMSSYQNAVSQAANEFANAILSAGINYNIAILTTSNGVENSCSSYMSLSDANYILCTTGIIENNVTLFKEKVIVGTSGSWIETGIYNAEYALQSIALGDQQDGILTTLGFPTDTNNSLAVIILSDEPSQYSSRAGYGNNFDVLNNLFIDRGYSVYSIVDPNDAADSQYDDLAIQTGGMVADISKTSDYGVIMNTIAQKASGTAGFKLQYSGVIESSIYVTKNGEEVPNNSLNGWKYNASSNSILFYGDYVAKEGDKIEVSYSYSSVN